VNQIKIELIAPDEEFKRVVINGEQFEHYYISNYARLYSLNRNRFLKPWMTGSKKRYCKFTLSHNGKPIDIYAHRLVALMFVINQNPDKFRQVNHKDETPSNNKWNNLEWCDRSYNQNYGTASQRKREKIGIIVKQFDLRHNEVATFDSIRQASILLGMSVTPIYSGIRDGLPHKGYYWRRLTPQIAA